MPQRRQSSQRKIFAGKQKTSRFAGRVTETDFQVSGKARGAVRLVHGFAFPPYRSTATPVNYAGVEFRTIVASTTNTAVAESRNSLVAGPAVVAKWQIVPMNAEPILRNIAKALQDCRLEAILVGNAAAALQGAPVTTLDFDFMFRNTPLNLKKLKKVAESLGMSQSQPYYPASDLYRLFQEDTGIQLDFMSRLHGVRSFESLKSRASEVYFGTARLLVADLKDIIRSKRALGRDKDLAVLGILEKTQREKEKAKE